MLQKDKTLILHHQFKYFSSFLNYFVFMSSMYPINKQYYLSVFVIGEHVAF